MLLTPPAGFVPKSSKFNNGHWQFPEQMGKKAGFVYIIRDNILQKFYIGKKNYRASGGLETNWRKYTSSSNTINALIKDGGKDSFDFFCLEEYATRGNVSYIETWSLCHVNALLSDRWYNRRIEKISWNVKDAATDRHVQRLAAILRMETPDV